MWRLFGCSNGRKEVFGVGSQITRLGLLSDGSTVIGTDVSCDLLIRLNGCGLMPAKALSHLGWESPWTPANNSQSTDTVRISTHQWPHTNNTSATDMSPSRISICHFFKKKSWAETKRSVLDYLFPSNIVWSNIFLKLVSTWNLQKVNKTINKRGYSKFELLHPLAVIQKHAAVSCLEMSIFFAPIATCFNIA